jgi:hypothetical protein
MRAGLAVRLGASLLAFAAGATAAAIALVLLRSALG